MHQHHQSKHSLGLVIFLTLIVLLLELLGSQITKSLALVSDAAHMFTDLSILIISWISVKIAQRPENRSKTFGYHRIEVLAAAFNTVLMFIMSFYILFEAAFRIMAPQTIHSPLMFVFACIGLAFNFFSIHLLQSDKDKSMSLKSAYLEVLADALSSAAVLITGILIYFTHWYWLDSLIAVFIGLWILPRAIHIFKECLDILLESVPKHIDFNEVSACIETTKGVTSLQDLHIWSINHAKICLTSHIEIEENMDAQSIIQAINRSLYDHFGIEHTTLQVLHRPITN